MFSPANPQNKIQVSFTNTEEMRKEARAGDVPRHMRLTFGPDGEDGAVRAGGTVCMIIQWSGSGGRNLSKSSRVCEKFRIRGRALVVERREKAVGNEEDVDGL